MVIEGARLKFVSKNRLKKGEIEEVYYTGPEERFKHTADEGGPSVIVSTSLVMKWGDETRKKLVASGDSRKCLAG
jgi:hypothetical protein